MFSKFSIKITNYFQEKNMYLHPCSPPQNHKGLWIEGTAQIGQAAERRWARAARAGEQVEAIKLMPGLWEP